MIDPKLYTSLSDEEVLAGRKLAELQSTFLRSVEHELRTPVAIIHGYAELLCDGSLGTLDPEQAKAIFTITHRAHELRVLVERITSLLMIKAQVAAVSLINLRDVVAKVVEIRQTKAIKAGVTLTVDCTTDLPPVTGHPYYLQQAVDCLVENALKFTPDGGQVELKLAANPEWVYLMVMDTGIGIAEDKVAFIYDSFYQIDGSTTRKYGGLGLGLTLVKAVIEAYSGQIEVESQLGQGSRFTIKLPISRLTGEMNRIPGQNNTSQRVLIVDDEYSLALTLQHSLQILSNCEVVTATGGEQALELFEQQPFNLLITDYKMPGMDGLSLVNYVRQLYPQTVIVMITAYTDNELYEQAARFSIQRILNKPVKLNEFRRVAAEILQGSISP